jgi:uncharacterized protein (DUF2062 family)
VSPEQAALLKPVAEEPPAAAPPPPEPSLVRRFRNRFLHMLGRDDPPDTVAASFAIGVAISFTPLIGFHWIIALALAFLLRLNKVDVILGTLVVNPLTLGPASFVAYRLGRILLKARNEAIAELPWSSLFSRSFWDEAGPAMRSIGVQWGTGMFALSILAGALTYVVLGAILHRRLERKADRHGLLGLRGGGG